MLCLVSKEFPPQFECTAARADPSVWRRPEGRLVLPVTYVIRVSEYHITHVNFDLPPPYTTNFDTELEQSESLGDLWTIFSINIARGTTDPGY